LGLKLDDANIERGALAFPRGPLKAGSRISNVSIIALSEADAVREVTERE
jgi:hypothetical protein